MDVLHGFDYVFDNAPIISKPPTRLTLARAVSKHIITNDGAKWFIAEFSL